MAKAIKTACFHFALFVVGCIFVLGGDRSARAQVAATAQITAQQVSAGEWQYNITLDDTGTTDLETLWYAWTPGKGFLHAQPSGIVSPTGWTDAISETYAIQFTTKTNPLAAGSSLSGFQFDSTDSPSQIFGLSQAFPGTPVGTSFVYEGAPLSQFSAEIVVTPEPSTLVLGGLGFLGLTLAAWRRQAKRSVGRR